MRVIEKGILEMTSTEKRQCRSLSLRGLGLMCEDLRDWTDYESRPNRARRKCRVWMIKDESDRLIAWALATPRWKARGYEAQFYVRQSERGKGYGSLLMEKVLQYDPQPHVFPHDNISGGFFKKHRDSIRFDKKTAGWLN